MKFVVMPAEIPKNAYYLSNEHLNAEEIRVEGLRKLIAVIEKGTYKKDQNKPKLPTDFLMSISTPEIYTTFIERSRKLRYHWESADIDDT